jgi:hypothetical protein
MDGHFVLGEILRVGDAPREYEICSATSLRELLAGYSASRQMLFFQAPGGDCLTIGLSHSLAFVEFNQASGMPPYLAARGDSESWHEYMEFIAGDTPTEIPLAICIPTQTAIEIAVHFFIHGRIPEDVEWVE